MGYADVSLFNSITSIWGFFGRIGSGSLSEYFLKMIDLPCGLVRHQNLCINPEEVIKRMNTDVEEFFGLPLEEKKAYAQVSGDLEGYGQAFVVSEEQQLDWTDIYSLSTQPVALRNMKFWPSHPPTMS